MGRGRGRGAARGPPNGGAPPAPRKWTRAATEEGVRGRAAAGTHVVVADDDDVVALLLSGPDLVGEEARSARGHQHSLVVRPDRTAEDRGVRHLRPVVGPVPVQVFAGARAAAVDRRTRHLSARERGDRLREAELPGPERTGVRAGRDLEV